MFLERLQRCVEQRGGHFTSGRARAPRVGVGAEGEGGAVRLCATSMDSAYRTACAVPVLVSVEAARRYGSEV